MQAKVTIKKFIKSVPVLGTYIQKMYEKFKRRDSFTSSSLYWESRYAQGGNSGDGSYDKLAEFKAEILNDFVSRFKIRTVIEYGCGDGNQLSYANYPEYIGFDISPTCIGICKNKFINDKTKKFKLIDEYTSEKAELVLSLDVIFHLVEDDVYDRYMRQLFDTSLKYVIIYSSNTDDNSFNSAPHVKHRKFTDWILLNRPNWKIVKFIPNKYPFKGNTKTGSFCDFYIYVNSELA